MTNYWGVVPAAGCGKRFNADTPKQYTRIAGACVLEYSLTALLRSRRLRGIVVALAANDMRWSQTRYRNDPRVMTCHGGVSRAQSVMNALDLLRPQVKASDWVLVHDAVRPCLSERDLQSLVNSLHTDPVGGLLVSAVSDTLKIIDDTMGCGSDNATPPVVMRTLARARVIRALTPQMFRFGLLSEALDSVLCGGTEVSDEAQAVELAGYTVRTVAGDAANIKLTYPHELPVVEAWLKRHAPQNGER